MTQLQLVKHTRTSDDRYSKKVVAISSSYQALKTHCEESYGGKVVLGYVIDELPKGEDGFTIDPSDIAIVDGRTNKYSE